MAGKIERLTREIFRFGYEVAANGFSERVTTERFFKAVKEQSNIRSRFDKEEKNILAGDGALILELGCETLRQLRVNGKPFLHLTDGGEKLLDTPTKLTEVAIYPQPSRFFVQNSNWKNFDRQICMVYEDGMLLRRRLRLPTVTQIMPEAVDLAQIIFKYPEVVKSLSAGQYGDREIRTVTPVKTGSDVYTARVKILDESGLLDITVCDVKHGNPYIWVPRIIVPRRHPVNVGNSLIL